jgi:uncharacterized phiE125 gp8 family phage protein
MIIKTTTEPAVEPVSLTEVKLHCRVAIDAASASAYTAEDDWLTRSITAARVQAEQETGRRFVTQTLTLYLDSWPDEDFIKIPYPPLQSAAVTYRLEGDGDYDNTLTIVDVDIVSEPGLIKLQPDESWPDGTLYSDKPVKIVFVCGYGLATAVPSGIQSAILLKIEDLYNNRGEVVVGAAVNRISDAVDSLLRNYRIHTEFD